MSYRRIAIITFCLSLLLLAMVLITPSAAYSQPAETPEKPGKPGRMKVMRMGIGLTDEQKQNLKIIRNKYNPRIDDTELEIQRKRLDLVAELKKDEPDRKKIEARLDDLAALQKKRHKIILDEYFDVRKILTPDQNKFYVRKLIRSMIGPQVGKP